jgi:hypothetical protein
MFLNKKAKTVGAQPLNRRFMFQFWFIAVFAFSTIIAYGQYVWQTHDYSPKLTESYNDFLVVSALKEANFGFINNAEDKLMKYCQSAKQYPIIYDFYRQYEYIKMSIYGGLWLATLLYLLTIRVREARWSALKAYAIGTLLVGAVIYYAIDQTRLSLFMQLNIGAAVIFVTTFVGFLVATKKVTGLRDIIEDIKTLDKMKQGFDPEKHINLKKGIFVGLDERRKPIYLPRNTISNNHLDILGASGTGKSSFVGLLLSQLAMLGESVIVMDPKHDKRLPFVLSKMAKKHGFEFTLIDLNSSNSQLNPFYGCSELEVEELLQVGLELGKTGDAAVDYYRGKDRAGARLLRSAKTIQEAITMTSSDERITVDAENMFRELCDIGRVEAIKTSKGFDLKAFLEAPKGGVLYVVGSTKQYPIFAAQRMVLQRVLQILDTRNNETKPVALFMDELKYLLSPAALRAAGTVRDRNCHLIFAHQSIGDLHDAAGLKPEAVIGAVVGNTSLKLVYKLPDTQTAKEVSEAAGIIRTTEISRSVNDQSGETHTERKSQERLIPVHVFTNLPKPVPEKKEASVGVLIGDGLPKFISTRWISVSEKDRPQVYQCDDEPEVTLETQTNQQTTPLKNQPDNFDQLFD